jgi:FkbM family methyltransferase
MVIKRIANKVARMLGAKPLVPPSPLQRYVDTSSLYPASALLRLGTAYGGWYVPVDCGLNETSICYLAGAGEDISFDCALAARYNCQVRIVDPTPKAIAHFDGLSAAVKVGKRFPINNSKDSFYEIAPQVMSRIRFLPFGLTDRDVVLKFYLPKNPDHVSCSTLNLQKTDTWFVAQCYTLTSLMAAQGDAQVDLLKMDIEGGEYAVIEHLTSTGFLPRLLLIEFDEAHTPLDSSAGDRIQENILMLEKAGMRCISLDGCNATFIRQS